MHLYRHALVLATLMLPYGSAAFAATQNVECPVARVEAKLTTQLPDGWWYTPTVNSLQEVRIQNIGGQHTLMCMYKAFSGQVAVMRQVPAGARGCKADKKRLRFVCFTD